MGFVGFTSFAQAHWLTSQRFPTTTTTTTNSESQKSQDEVSAVNVDVILVDVNNLCAGVCESKAELFVKLSEVLQILPPRHRIYLMMDCTRRVKSWQLFPAEIRQWWWDNTFVKEGFSPRLIVSDSSIPGSADQKIFTALRYEFTHYCLPSSSSSTRENEELPTYAIVSRDTDLLVGVLCSPLAKRCCVYLHSEDETQRICMSIPSVLGWLSSQPEAWASSERGFLTRFQPHIDLLLHCCDQKSTSAEDDASLTTSILTPPIPPVATAVVKSHAQSLVTDSFSLRLDFLFLLLFTLGTTELQGRCAGPSAAATAVESFRFDQCWKQYLRLRMTHSGVCQEPLLRVSDHHHNSSTNSKKPPLERGGERLAWAVNIPLLRLLCEFLAPFERKKSGKKNKSACSVATAAVAESLSSSFQPVVDYLARVIRECHFYALGTRATTPQLSKPRRKRKATIEKRKREKEEPSTPPLPVSTDINEVTITAIAETLSLCVEESFSCDWEGLAAAADYDNKSQVLRFESVATATRSATTTPLQAVVYFRQVHAKVERAKTTKEKEGKSPVALEVSQQQTQQPQQLQLSPNSCSWSAAQEFWQSCSEWILRNTTPTSPSTILTTTTTTSRYSLNSTSSSLKKKKKNRISSPFQPQIGTSSSGGSSSCCWGMAEVRKKSPGEHQLDQEILKRSGMLDCLLGLP